jgi:opacity protein-like surface antigen
MKIRWIGFNAVLAILFSTGSLFAGDTNTWYVGTDAGVNFQREVLTSYSPNQYFPAAETKFHPGERFDLKLGYNLRSWLAVELDAGLAHNGVSSYRGNSVTDVDFFQFPLMANLILSRQVWHNFSVYGGAGAGGIVGRWDGLAQVRFDFNPNVFRFETGRAEGDLDCVPGFQALGGIKYAIGDHWDLRLGYKFLSTTEGNDWTISGREVRTDVAVSQSVFAALTYKF